MGYVTRFTGEIRIEPPIPWGEVKDSPFLPERARENRSGRDLMFVVREVERDTADGVVIVRSAVGLVSTWDSEARGYDILEHLREVVDAYPDHTFVGRLDCKGEETGDLWRLEVQDRRAVRVEPRIVWPDDVETPGPGPGTASALSVGDEPDNTTALYWPETDGEFAQLLLRDDAAASALGRPDRRWFEPNGDSEPVDWDTAREGLRRAGFKVAEARLWKAVASSG